MATERYLTPNSLEELCDEDGGFRCTIKDFTREVIDGRPNVVMYILEDERGIIVTRRLYDDLCELFGPAPEKIREFFQTEGLH